MRKKIVGVVLAALVGGGIGAALGYGPLLRYKSDGVLSVDLSSQEYKRIYELANNPTVMQRFAELTPPPGGGGDEGGTLVSKIRRQSWLAAVPRVSKEDASLLPDYVLEAQKVALESMVRRAASAGDDDSIRIPREFMGVDISYTASSPIIASKVADWLGSYFKNAATLEAMQGLVSEWSVQTRNFSDSAQDRRLQYQFDIKQAQARADAFKKILDSYPNIGKNETSQVIDIRQENEKFISPLAQLVGAESDVIRLEGKLRELDRQSDQEAIMNDLVGPAQAAISTAETGSQSVDKINAVIRGLSANAQTPAQKALVAALQSQVTKAATRFQWQPHFIAPPSALVPIERPGPIAVAFFGVILAAVLAAMTLWRRSLLGVLLSGQANREEGDDAKGVR